MRPTYGNASLYRSSYIVSVYLFVCLFVCLFGCLLSIRCFHSYSVKYQPLRKEIVMVW